MLRSRSELVVVRWAFYSLAAFCISVFVYMLFHVVRIALAAPYDIVRVVLGITAFVAVALFVAAAVVAFRSSHPGGHFLVSMASLAGAFVSFVGLLMIAA